MLSRARLVCRVPRPMLTCDVAAGIPLVARIVPDLGDAVEELPVEFGVAGNGQEIGIVDRAARSCCSRFRRGGRARS